MKTKILIIALIATFTWSSKATNELPINTPECSELQTKVVCVNGEEVTIYNLDNEVATFTINIVWKRLAEYPGNVNYLQTRANRRASYQSEWGMHSFYQVVDNNREIWTFTTTPPDNATDVEAAMEKDDDVAVDGD
jgi:hypothetical protein